jgi:DhnA family fructose-bisphosphate aldolase class Ia
VRGSSPNLETLAQEAETVGLPNIDDRVLAAIQCAADVRYQRMTLNVNEVLRANHAAMEVGAVVMKTLYP